MILTAPIAECNLKITVIQKATFWTDPQKLDTKSNQGGFDFDLHPQIGQLWARKIDGVVELQNDLANIAGGRSPSDECGLKQL